VTAGADHPLFRRMRGDVPGVAWPPLFSTRKSSLAALLFALERSQWLSAEELQVGQLRQLTGLAAHFDAHSPRFRERLRSAGVEASSLGRSGGLQALPPLTRREVQRDPESLFCRAVPEGHAPLRLFQTSGSTGEPVKVMKTAVTQLFWTALTLRYHLWQEPDFTGRLCGIRALVKEAQESDSWGAPFSEFFDTGPSLVIDNATDLALQIEEVRRFRPESLIIYPTNLRAMIDRMERQGTSLPELKRVRTIGETLPPELRVEAERQLGVEVRDCYSSEEFGYVAIECREGGSHHLMSEALLVEVVDEQGRPCVQGEVGRVLVTDLQNYATPVIRYEIGEYAEPGGPCPCGRGLPTLRRILGRTRNMVVRPDGSTYWPITGFKRFRDLAPIVQYQLVQDSLTSIEVRLVVEAPLSSEQERAVGAHIQSFLGYPFETRFRYFEGRIPTGPNGKFEEFKSLVASPASG
jgi:phenylacetate-CoA ligase